MPQGWMGWEVSCHPFLAHSLQSSHQGETSWEEGLSSLAVRPFASCPQVPHVGIRRWEVEWHRVGQI